MQEKSRGSKKVQKQVVIYFGTGHSAGNLSLHITLKKNSTVMSCPRIKKRSLWQLESLEKNKTTSEKIVKGQLLSQCLHLEGTHYHGDDTIFLQLLN